MICSGKHTLKYLKTLKDFNTPERVVKFYAKSNQQQRDWLNYFILTQRVRRIEHYVDFLCNVFKI